MPPTTVPQAFPSDVLFHAGLELSVNGTIYAFMAAVLFVVLFKSGLQIVERYTVHHTKYFILLNKMYKELMVSGLITFTSNRLSQFGVVRQDSPEYNAWEVADDMIFFFAISLAVQSVIMFWRLQARNLVLDKLSLMTSQELYDEATSNGDLSEIPKQYVSITKMSIVRHFFLTKYKLPQLFCYSKYLRAIQDVEIIELFDVEFFTWIILLLVYSAIFFLSEVFLSFQFDLNDPDARKMVHNVRLIVISVAIAILTVFLLLIYAYLKNVVYRMVLHAGGDEKTLTASLQRVAQEESTHRVQETAARALFKMHHVADSLSDRHDRSSIGDLVLTIIRKITGCKYRTKADRQSSHFDLHAMDLPWFSRKATHVGVKFLLTLNALYFGFLFQAFVVLIVDHVGASIWILSGLMLYILVVHMGILAPRIARQLAFVNATVRANPVELKSVVEHYAEVLELQHKMAHDVHKYLNDHAISLEVFMAGLEMDDPEKTGYMEGTKLRKYIKRYGFKFSKLKFTSFIRLQFETKGTSVKYSKLLDILRDEGPNALEETQHHVSLGPSSPKHDDKTTPLLSSRHKQTYD
ncbi:hypothetical protein THRCLA_05382 [Thraustotheca clavata]|uniref:EF-hand domain-containing protein n=1 Tax=Thraustotheca clavata TaxID=74557 RepID=A0A1V9ZW28_9STRA|nr:hypothetical protein THRCLA_05382 [Thraustotheca clavata]